MYQALEQFKILLSYSNGVLDIKNYMLPIFTILVFTIILSYIVNIKK